MHWKLLPSVHLSVSAALTVGGLFIALRDFKIGNGSSCLSWLSGKLGAGGDLGKCDVVVPGLQNLGNNCFLNVVLQALSSCDRFQEYLIKVIEEYEYLPIQRVKSMLPLIVALADLMEELNTTSDRRVVRSPQKVMQGVQCYTPDFSLTIQQDAAEAFLHLLCSFRDEVSESYVPYGGSLADVLAVTRRILDPKRWGEDQTEQQRWKELYLGPLDGILGNVLTCRSCSAQIMMDFELFHSLPLLPVTGMGTSIFYGCSLEHCLKQYIGAEEIEGYKCDHCWHVAAMKYLSAVDGSETNIQKLMSCSGQECCKCRSIQGLEAIPDPVSRAFKKLSVAQCPEILCIQLLRASTNLFGDLIKLEGHISFPLILNLMPFMMSGVEREYIGCSSSMRHANEQGQQLYPLPPSIYRQLYWPNKEKLHSETSDEKKLVSGLELTNQKTDQSLDEDLPVIEGSADSGPNQEDMHRQSTTKAVVATFKQAPTVPTLYRLVSVVEHFGRSGVGHYTVYRRLRSQSDKDSATLASSDQWFLISDSDVSKVSETDVLTAHASMIFYERITDSS